MIGKITLAVIKPDAVQKGYIGPIISHIIDAEFHIKAIKTTDLSKSSAKIFYEKHRENSYFHSLIEFMSSGPIVTILLEKENAVEDFRKLIGYRDPIHAQNGTIRKLYASSLEKNAIHGSDSNQNAFKECNFYFSNQEIL
ncbi:nucleoside-diphosphate kinase [Blattabacterium cuenoti]|uniref:nucleoside-diphosphate kinase n=1 Tax=Blattabacterium cuenoti TaxID=1653831 RepID=UPI00163BB202|nr:nucleoside-diphosphate kinase [Blattabacterium cuenoti]